MSANLLPEARTDDEIPVNIEHRPKASALDEKDHPGSDHLEQVITAEQNLHYDEIDEEPELHARTWLALTAMMLLNMVQVVALTGPPAVVCQSCLVTILWISC